MKVSIISQSDYHSGAMISAYRLHDGLRKAGIDSTILVGEKSTDDENIIAPDGIWGNGWHQRLPALDCLPLDIIHRNRNKNLTFHLEWVPDNIIKRINKISPEIVNLHWINRGFLQIETLAKIRQPMVWTLHDMWAFTGGCHYSGDCARYTKSCGACPQLTSDKDWDLSRWVWQRKSKAWKGLNLTIVTPSKWLSDCAKASPLFQGLQIEVIPNGLDTQIYKPMDRVQARNILGLPIDKK
jgi:glycosyltransferase involved in cell wall biosynthesis